MRSSPSSPAAFDPELICAIHMGDKRQIAAALAVSRLGAGVLIYHGIHEGGGCTCADFNCPNPGKHPFTTMAERGVKSATRDPKLAWQWFNTFPDHNLALVLGSDLAAIDMDPRHGADLEDSYGLPVRTMTARSGGGGLHRLYRIRPTWKLNGTTIEPGVDLRTGNQAIVVERSRHRSGGHYEWLKLSAPIRLIPKSAADNLMVARSQRRASRVEIDPHVVEDGWIQSQWSEVAHIRRALLRGKHRGLARLLLDGRWEDGGYPSQSEAEFNLVLLISGITDDQSVWLAVLRSSGLVKRDRDCTRREDGHGHKLVRPSYINALFSAVATRRAQLRHTGDPNLQAARHTFSSIANSRSTQLTSPTLPPRRGDVIDAKINRRGRPKGKLKLHAAKLATIRFLAGSETQRDREGFARLPVLHSALAADMSRETLRKAIIDLIAGGIVESREVKAYWHNEKLAKDRCLRLLVPAEDALAQLEKMQ